MTRAILRACVALLAGERPERRHVGARQFWFGVGIIAALLTGGAASTPFAGVQLTKVPGLLAVFSTAMVVINLLLAALLFIKGRVEDGPDTIRLGTTYLYVGLIIVPQTLSFPGALMPDPVIGTQATSLWFWVFWHVGFAVAVMRYALSAGKAPPCGTGLVRPVAGTAAAAACMSVIAVRWGADLPDLMEQGRFEFTGTGLFVHAVVAAATLAAFWSVARLRAATPEHLWLTVGLAASCFEIWLTLQGGARFSLGWYLAKGGSLATSVVVLVSLMHELARLYAEAALNNKALATLARRDALTGLSNRRHFDEALAQEFLRARRQMLPLSVIMIDVDRFKLFNDRYGHPAGDACLREVAGAIASALRRGGDTAFRYGGEEFAVLLPATDREGARLVGEAIRAAVIDCMLPHEASETGFVTASIGIGCALPFKGSDPAGALVAAADQALYEAKHRGRNRVCVGEAGTAAELLAA